MDFFNDSSSTLGPSGSTSYEAEVEEEIESLGSDVHYLKFYSFHTQEFLAVRFLLCFVGGVGNVLNIRTFLKIGLKDSVTFMLFNIAVADLNYITTMIVICVCQSIEWFPRPIFFSFKLHPYSVEMTCKDFILEVFSHVSVYGTTFVAIQRCLCVIRPIQFNGMFTRFRIGIVLGFFWIFNMAVSLIGVPWRGLLKESWIEGSYWITLIYTSLSRWNKFIRVSSIALGTVDGMCQFILVFCIIIMTRELNRSVQFRKSTSNIGSTKDGGKTDSVDVEKGQTKSKVESSVGMKERRITVQITLVAAFFILTNFHRLIFECAQLVPGVWDFFNNNWHYFKLYFRIYRLLYLVNVSVNFFIYFKYNTRFRKLCFKR